MEGDVENMFFFVDERLNEDPSMRQQALPVLSATTEEDSTWEGIEVVEHCNPLHPVKFCAGLQRCFGVTYCVGSHLVCNKVRCD